MSSGRSCFCFGAHENAITPQFFAIQTCAIHFFFFCCALYPVVAGANGEVSIVALTVLVKTTELITSAAAEQFIGLASLTDTRISNHRSAAALSVSSL